MNCLAVDPELQGSSLSLAVLDAAFALALKSGYSHVESDVLSIRPHLVAFYEKTGWVLTGERRPWPDRWTADLNPNISAAEAARLHMIMLHRTDQPSSLAALQRAAVSRNVFATTEAAARRDQLVGHYWQHGWAVQVHEFVPHAFKLACVGGAGSHGRCLSAAQAP